MQRYNICSTIKTKTSIFVLYCSHLFVPLIITSKVLTFDNKNKNFDFCFVLFSLIRTFDDKIVNI